ncbi:hypothetical protein [Pararhizobium haloflavum]|nr:hypothetical protein [Pararhizobium haloflavum]
MQTMMEWMTIVIALGADDAQALFEFGARYASVHSVTSIPS